MRGTFLVLVLSIIFLSGCTSDIASRNRGSGSGVVITSFSADKPEVFSGSPVEFTLILQNTGGFDSKKIIGQLFGGVSSGTGWVVDNSAVDLLAGKSELKAGSSGLDTEGETLEYIWEARYEPREELKVKTSFTAGLRVYYSYSTFAQATLRFYDNSYLKSLTPQQYEERVRSANAISQGSSLGPISVSFSTSAKQLISQGDPSETFPIQITINNIGGGSTVDPAAISALPPRNSFSDLNKVTYTIEATPMTITCPRGDSSISGTIISDPDAVLGAGKSKILLCSISGIYQVQNFQDLGIKVVVDYVYFVESTAKVSVLPRPGVIS